MIRRLIARWRHWRDIRRQAGAIDPTVFLEMATELRELADTASKLWQGDPAYKARADRIIDEMDQLTRIASRPEFRRLSAQKRLELRRSLIMSREQLLQSMTASPPATEIIQ